METATRVNSNPISFNSRMAGQQAKADLVMRSSSQPAAPLQPKSAPKADTSKYATAGAVRDLLGAVHQDLSRVLGDFTGEKEQKDGRSPSNGSSRSAEELKASRLKESLGNAYGTDSVKADTWKKGPNDTIEGMLKSKGFSLNEIYAKDKSGKNMVDRVLDANGLSDARKMRAGQEMVIPDLGKKGGGSSTAGLKPGQTTAPKEIGSHTAQSSKSSDGINKSEVSTSNGSNVSVKSAGDSTTATRERADGITATEILAKNQNGVVTTQVDTLSKGDTDSIKAKALKGQFSGQVTNDGVKLNNGGVTVNEDLSESNRDGLVENLGRGIDKFFGLAPKPEPAITFSGKNVQTVADGNKISVTADGRKVVAFDQDADDGLFERGGAKIDNGLKWLKDGLGLGKH